MPKDKNTTEQLYYFYCRAFPAFQPKTILFSAAGEKNIVLFAEAKRIFALHALILQYNPDPHR